MLARRGSRLGLLRARALGSLDASSRSPTSAIDARRGHAAAPSRRSRTGPHSRRTSAGSRAQGGDPDCDVLPERRSRSGHRPSSRLRRRRVGATRSRPRGARARRGTPDEGGLDRPRRRRPLLREARRHRRAGEPLVEIHARDEASASGMLPSQIRTSDRDRRRAPTAAPDRARDAEPSPAVPSLRWQRARAARGRDDPGAGSSRASSVERSIVSRSRTASDPSHDPRRGCGRARGRASRCTRAREGNIWLFGSKLVGFS